MVDQPLRAFSPPESLTVLLLDGVVSSTIIQWVLYTVFFFWLLYTLVAIYHWLKYSHASAIAFPAIGLHIFISAIFLIYAVSGIFS
jgi:hypothetical protein